VTAQSKLGMKSARQTDKHTYSSQYFASLPKAKYA